MRKRCLFQHVLFVLSWVVMSAPQCLADGKIYPSKAFKAVPDMPHQRAIIVHRDGEEKLIIESSFHGQGQDFGWIVPVPAEPTSFEPVSPGLMKSINMAIHPEITAQRYDKLRPLLILTFLVLSWSAIVHRQKPRPVASLLILLCTVFVAIGMMMPALNTAGSLHGYVSTRGVSVAMAQDVGNYHVVALYAQSPETLSSWLSANGFVPLPETDRDVVAQYIRDGWHFVAAKLHQDEADSTTPHPLALAFPAEVPVYPMKLTGTIGRDMYLELFIIAEQTHDHPALTVEVCDRFQHDLEADRFQGETSPGFVGTHFRQRLGHPDANDLLWDQCVVTRLCAQLGPHAMTTDFLLRPQPFKAKRKHYYTRNTAINEGMVAGLVCLITVVLVGTLPSIRALRSARTNRKHLCYIVCLVLGLALCVGLVAYMSLPKVATGKGFHRFSSFAHYTSVVLEATFNINRDNSKTDGFELLQAESIAADYFEANPADNLFEGKPMRLENSPGNYTIIQRGDDFFIRWYDAVGFPRDNDMPLFE